MNIELDRIYNMDCLEGMKQIPDGSVDAVICDLPYGTTSCAWDSVIPFEPLWEQYRRICKQNAAIVLFGSEPFSTMLRMSNLKEYRYDWIWHKSISCSFANAEKMPMKFHEVISVFYRALPTFNPQYQPYSESTQKKFRNGGIIKASDQKNQIQGLPKKEHPIEIKRGKHPESVLVFGSVPNCNGIHLHPTQKPVDLLRYLVLTYTNEGDTVLDNCMGSGTTAIACIKEKRHFIGFELNKEYFDKAVKRIDNEQRQLTLF